MSCYPLKLALRKLAANLWVESVKNNSKCRHKMSLPDWAKKEIEKQKVKQKVKQKEMLLNMFSKKPSTDIKISMLKFLTTKYDTSIRLKHLRIVMDHKEAEELPAFFEKYSKHIYYLLCDIITDAENNSKQRDITFHLVYKTRREELDSALFILEQLLLYLPELLGRGWQQHALLRTLCKLLHPGNSLKLRKDAIRYFIIWYQSLGENAPEEVDAVFATLVPGFPSPKPGMGLPSSPLPSTKNSPTSSVFHDSNLGLMSDLQPVLPPQSGEKPLEDPMKYFLDVLLDALVSQVNRIHWKEKLCKAHKSFSFLLERFKRFYLPHIFPTWNSQTNLYPPSLDLPSLRKSSPNGDGDTKDPILSCRVAVIKWVASFTHSTKKEQSSASHSNSVTPDTEHSSGIGSDFRRMSVNQIVPVPNSCIDQPTSLASLGDLGNETEVETVVREVFYSSRDNVCFILEVYRQAFLLPFSHAHAIRRAISVYKDWIQMNVPELPPFILEPIETGESNDSESRVRLRNDSYLGAVHKDYLFIRAGFQSTLQLFVTHAANVFLLQVKNPNLLEEQVDTCKRVLNIYRYMVMQSAMELKTWEQLLTILLHITGLVLTKSPPKRKEETLGGKLAQAIFQTLIVTWIKANLNVVISTALWDDFLSLLTSLTQWKELIKEWAKTLETLTRVLARHVYSLDLTDLPLDRLSEQQAKKRRGIKGSQTDGPKPLMGRKGSTKILKSQPNSLPETSTTPDTSGSFQFCSVRKRMDSLSDVPSQLTTVVSSSSEGNLTNLGRRRVKRQSHSTNKSNVVIPVLPVSVEAEVNRLIRCGSFSTASITRHPWARKWRSLDSLRPEDSPTITRSPSPAPSSGIETSSIKDSPMPLDLVTTDSSSLECSSNTGGRSVMAGGTITGWLPDVAVVLWRRMLGALGDVNRLPDPALHALVFDHLVELWETLAKIQANQGIPEEGVTPPPPVLTPPLTLFAPWCFKALELPDSYQRGKLSAYRLLCQMALRAGPWALSHSLLVHLYRYLHSGLSGPHPLIVWTVLKSLGPRFLSRQLPGYSLLLLDLISASNAVLESADLQLAPRIEAASLLGSVLSLPYMVSQAPSLDPRSSCLNMIKCAGAKDHVLASLLRCAKREPNGVARCTALSALAVFAYTELLGPSPHPAVEYAFDVILLALKFRQKSVSFVACDLLFALSDHMSALLGKFPRIPSKVLRFLAHTLGALGSNANSLGPVLALTLGEWAMRYPIPLLLAEKTSEPLLLTVFRVLGELSNGASAVETPSVEFSKEVLSDWENSIKIDDLKASKKASTQNSDTSSLACKAVLMHLVSHLGHFPMGLGPARLSALVQEHDDVPALGTELSTKLFYAPNIQFMLARNSLMSMIEVEYLPTPGGDFTAGLVTAPSQARVLLRDLANKASWDASALYCSPQDLPKARKTPKKFFNNTVRQRNDDPPMSLMTVSIPPRGTLRHRPSHILPTFQNAAPDMDNLHDLLRYIGHSSSECLENPDQDISEPGATPSPLNRHTEAEVISAILAQRTLEQDYKQYSEPMKPCSAPVHEPCNAPFQHCRQLFSQLGLAGWERRSQIQLLARSERLLRELRNLDTQRGRETHKVAVIYVAAGQEDKTSILSNKGGSQAYEQFVAGLAWEVELASHTGFNGGLGSGCGDTAPYFATAFVETLFHVSTRMPSDTEEALLQKMRHLGNDEVHIVWSEHNRDYRRSSLPTEFCDVLIVVYPLPDSLYRVTIDAKPDTPVFGPLWNEAIVEGKALAGLVRAAALSASRAKRRILPHYQSFYEERFRSLSGVISNHKDPHTFEEFVAAIYSPGLPPPPPRTSQIPISRIPDHCGRGSDGRSADKISPQPGKNLSFRPESESPVFSRIK